MALFINQIFGAIFPAEIGMGDIWFIIIFGMLLLLSIFICAIIFYIKTIVAMYKTENYIWLILSILVFAIILIRFFSGAGAIYATDFLTGESGYISTFGLYEILLPISVNIAFYLFVYRKKNN